MAKAGEDAAAARAELARRAGADVALADLTGDAFEAWSQLLAVFDRLGRRGVAEARRSSTEKAKR
ncbi:MAG: hypothetical protein AAF192_21100 [Pseudomonadota bacterium]